MPYDCFKIYIKMIVKWNTLNTLEFSINCFRTINNKYRILSSFYTTAKYYKAFYEECKK